MTPSGGDDAIVVASCVAASTAASRLLTAEAIKFTSSICSSSNKSGSACLSWLLQREIAFARTWKGSGLIRSLLIWRVVPLVAIRQSDSSEIDAWNPLTSPSKTASTGTRIDANDLWTTEDSWWTFATFSSNDDELETSKTLWDPDNKSDSLLLGTIRISARRSSFVWSCSQMPPNWRIEFELTELPICETTATEPWLIDSTIHSPKLSRLILPTGGRKDLPISTNATFKSPWAAAIALYDWRFWTPRRFCTKPWM